MFLFYGRAGFSFSNANAKAVGLRKVVPAFLAFLRSRGLGCHPATPCNKSPKMLGATFATPSRIEQVQIHG